LAFLLGLLSVTMAMGKTAELPEMAKPEMAEDSKDQRAASERMDKEDAMEKREEKSDSSKKCDISWKSKSGYSCEKYRTNEWCRFNGDYGNGWQQGFGTFEEWTDVEGRSALVCPQCGCGGLIRVLRPTTKRFFVIPRQFLSWSEKRKACQDLDADLATVETKEEQIRLREYLIPLVDYYKDKRGWHYGADAWFLLGAIKEDDHDHWKWINGNSFSCADPFKWHEHESYYNITIKGDNNNPTTIQPYNCDTSHSRCSLTFMVSVGKSRPTHDGFFACATGYPLCEAKESTTRF